MPRSYSEHYQRKREYLAEQVEAGNIANEDADAIRELVDAFDEDRPTTSKPHWPDAPNHITKYRADSTLANWLYFLNVYAEELHANSSSLLDADTRAINEVAENWLNGTAHTRDEPLTKGTIRAYQNSARIFYRYHEDTDVDNERIAVFERSDTSIDPRDMLTREEIHDARDGTDNPRDKTIFDLLIYCGMRNNALRTLRIKDINLDNGKWYFNTTANGLKHIYKPSAPRPLLGAEQAVRDWIDYHPYSDDPEAYLVIPKPKWNDVDPHEQVSDRTVGRVLSKIKDNTDIEKPMHPHAIRHNFVTLCKREYDLDDGTVKFLIGHASDSTVMETTYSHLSAKDHGKKAKKGAGLLDEDKDESPLTPPHCEICGRPLRPSAKACEDCGAQYTPDGYDVRQKIADAIYEAKGEASDDEEEIAVDEIKEYYEENKQDIVQMIRSDPDLDIENLP